ncbi:MAG: MFS transporter [Desulfobacterales bacterium]|jgi:PPP family 3-phenylpropionic acid transporter|nr:MFS transporter [Desulfobacterales bacterium]
MKSVKLSLGCQYFFYFGALGAFLPYFNLYCHHLGFSGFQIGVLSSIRTLATALFPMLWGALADRFMIRRPLFIFCNLLSAAIWALYLFTTGFTPMLVITAFYGFFYAPIISFLETFSMDLLGGEKIRYGELRAWGSISFIIVVIAVGQIIDVMSSSVIIALILIGSVLQSYGAFKLPETAAPKEKKQKGNAKTVFDRRILIFLFCAFLMLASHGTYYGFFSIHLENMGYSAIFIGLSWAIASIAEIGVMVASEKIFKRFSYESILLFSFVMAGMRWIAMSFAVSPWTILLTQVLHAATYGAFHMSSILYMDKLTPGGLKTLGQAINNAVTYGFGIMAGFLLNGFFFEIIGAQKLFAISSALAAMGGIILFFNRSEDNQY